jgi:hypothetical protein
VVGIDAQLNPVADIVGRAAPPVKALATADLCRRKVVVTQRFFDEAAMAHLHANGCEVIVADLPAGQADGDLSHETRVHGR